jgi:hypothetical protein
VRRRWEVDRESWLEKEIPQDQHSQVIQSGVSRRGKSQNYGTFLLGRIDTMQNEAGDRREDACPAREEEKRNSWAIIRVTASHRRLRACPQTQSKRFQCIMQRF